MKILVDFHNFNRKFCHFFKIPLKVIEFFARILKELRNCLEARNKPFLTQSFLPRHSRNINENNHLKNFCLLNCIKFLSNFSGNFWQKTWKIKNKWISKKLVAPSRRKLPNLFKIFLKNKRKPQFLEHLH